MATGVCAKAAFNRSSALYKLRGTGITVGSRLKEVVFRLKSSIDLFLKRKLRFIYCPLFKERTRSLNEVIDYPSVVCLLTCLLLAIKANEIPVRSSFDSHLKSTQRSLGSVFCKLNMLTALSAHTVAMVTMDHLWLPVHLSASTPLPSTNTQTCYCLAPS